MFLFKRKHVNFRDDLTAITSEEMKGCLCVWNIGALCSQTSLNLQAEMAVICQIG